MAFLRRVVKWAAITAAVAIVPSARAALLGPGLGTQNTTQPPGMPAWFNLGKISIGGGVYIGNGWVLTAAHLDPFTNHAITFYPGDNFPNGGVTVQLDQSTYHQLHNPDNTNVDLVLIRTLTDPGLPMLDIATSTPAAGTGLTLAGFGVNRGSAVQYQVTGSNWQPVGSGGNFSGYAFNPNDVDTATVSKRWGTNLTSTFPGNQLTLVANNPAINGFTTVFTTDFESGTPTPSESIGVSGDSGGAVFSSTNPNRLLGIMLYQDFSKTPAGQPAGTAIYGNGTDSGNLATYYSEIFSVTGVPEPSTALLVVGGAGLLAARRRKTR